MFRKYYKAANDERKPNRELIDKIFDEYSRTEPQKIKGKIYSFGTRYGVAFAAVLVLCMAAMVYPQIAKLNEEPAISEYRNSRVIDTAETKTKIAGAVQEQKESYEMNMSELKAVEDYEFELAVNTLEEKLGKSDKDTGNIYSFEIAGKLETADKIYYLGRWRWLVDDHSSLICDFVLSDDLTGLYECSFNGDTVSWNTDINMFD